LKLFFSSFDWSTGNDDEDDDVSFESLRYFSPSFLLVVSSSPVLAVAAFVVPRVTHSLIHSRSVKRRRANGRRWQKKGEDLPRQVE